jgi:uncharacterized protein
MWPFCFRTLACFARHHFAAPAICACDELARVIITIRLAKQISPAMSFSSGSKRVAVIATGWLFILLGIIGLFLPVLQGILFLLVGLVILSTEYHWARKLLRRVEARFPKIGQLIAAAHNKADSLLRRGKKEAASETKETPL